MIPRYEVKEVSQIWNDHNKFKCFLEVELQLLAALESKNKIPSGISETIRKSAEIRPDRINEIELTTRHDVIAFCTSITEQLPLEIGKYFHFGVTSSDIIDSALTLQIKESLKLSLDSFEKFNNELYQLAIAHQNTICMGRSHGIFAEPMSFGQKLMGHYVEFARRKIDLVNFYQNELTLQLSGAVGNYTIIKPEIEEIVAKNLDLKVETISTQIIPRDRIAKLISITSLIANAFERLAVELRHLHHSDINEIAEGFQKGQKGSSTMPHKKNPISGENITGLSRYLRSHLNMALENSILWHERDISHSSAERLYLPDHFGILVYIFERFKTTIKNLEVNVTHMENKVMNMGHYLSSFYLHQCIDKISAISREDLYATVQKVSFNEEARKSPKAFRQELIKELKTQGHEIDLPEITPDEIRKIYLSGVPRLFERVKKEFLQ